MRKNSWTELQPLRFVVKITLKLHRSDRKGKLCFVQGSNHEYGTTCNNSVIWQINSAFFGMIKHSSLSEISKYRIEFPNPFFIWEIKKKSFITSGQNHIVGRANTVEAYPKQCCRSGYVCLQTSRIPIRHYFIRIRIQTFHQKRVEKLWFLLFCDFFFTFYHWRMMLMDCRGIRGLICRSSE